MTTKMPMMFSQNFGFTGKISRRPLPMVGVVSGPLIIPSPVAAPASASQQPSTRQRAVPLTSRSAPAPATAPAPRSIKQLFNMSNVMSNPGMPCRACGG